jgi:hypothetical protein
VVGSVGIGSGSIAGIVLVFVLTADRSAARTGTEPCPATDSMPENRCGRVARSMKVRSHEGLRAADTRLRR